MSIYVTVPCHQLLCARHHCMIWRLISKVVLVLSTEENCYTVFIVYKELRSTGHFDMMDLKTDEEEHSIEMHLPYTAKMMERSIVHIFPL